MANSHSACSWPWVRDESHVCATDVESDAWPSAASAHCRGQVMKNTHSGQNYILNWCHAQTRVVPYRLWGFQYSRRYRKWGYRYRVIPYRLWRFCATRKGQGEARLNLYYNNFVGYSHVDSGNLFNQGRSNWKVSNRRVQIISPYRIWYSFMSILSGLSHF